jgi:hypothetical protein
MEGKTMVDQVRLRKFLEEWEIPDGLASSVEESILVLPGETEEEYLEVMSLMIEDTGPRTNIDWLCAIDLASLWWEIRRYRIWMTAIIKTNRAEAVEKALYWSDPNYRLVGPQPTICAQARADAAKWHSNSDHRNQLNVRLRQHGYDDQGISAQAFVSQTIPLATIQRFLASARSQVNAILREMAVRREFARRAREAIEKRLAAEPVEQGEVKKLAAR